MSDSDHIVIEGEAVTLDADQMAHCSSQGPVTVIVEKLTTAVAAEVISCRYRLVFFYLWVTFNLTLNWHLRFKKTCVLFLFQATESTLDDPGTRKESASSPNPEDIIITVDLRAQLLSPILALSEGDLQIITEGSEDMAEQSESEC